MQRSKTRHNRLRTASSCLMVLLCLVGGSPTLLGDWRDDIGYTKLINVLGASAPNGAGVPISLVEASSTGGAYYPDVSSSEFSMESDPLGVPVSFSDADGTSGQASGITNHSTSQASTFFGNTLSVAPAANAVTIYEANDYLQDILNLTGTNFNPPETQNFRVQNFSWIGDFGTDSENREALRRFDFAIDTNNITAVVGLDNTTSVLPPLLSHGYNSLAVGRTDGVHSTGLTHLADYGVGRSKPDLVAPRGTTSAATSSVSSAATFLHSSVTVMEPDAANSETMRAILLAGATKDEFPTWSQIDGGGQWHPLDDTYGAGELNLYNSYLTILEGQAVGDTMTPTPVGRHGWDYQTVQHGPGNELLYDFVIASGSTAAELSIVLAWNAEISSPFNTGDPVVANLNLELVDSNGVTIDLDVGDTLVEGLSASDVDNVEHLYLTDLAAGTYTLKVSNVSSDELESDFGLAWRTSTLFDTFSADFDEDGDVDGVDLLTWQRGNGTLINATHADGDANGDGTVDSDDLAIYLAAFPTEMSLLGNAILAVPEPTTWVLAVAGLLLVLGLRYRQRHPHQHLHNGESMPRL